MKTGISLLCLLLSLPLAPGCSLVARNAVVNGKISDLQDLPRIDPNDPNCSVSSIKVVNAQSGEVEVEIKENAFAINMGKDPYRVKYREHPGPKATLDNNIRLPGELLGSSREYPVNIDTGVSGYVLVNDLHILENRLPIYSSPDGQDGICCLPDLRIGELIFGNLVAQYYFKHSELQLFRLPIEKNREIVIGLSLLQRFKYVIFDNIKKEVEFSSTQSFPAGEQAQWSRYPFSIQPDAIDNSRIFVEIPIGGQGMKLTLDTGCEPALLTSEKVWRVTQKRLHQVKRSSKTAYAPFAGGKIPSRTVIVEELKVGDSTLENACICILPDDSLTARLIIKERRDGILGMQCFADTIVALDFEREVMSVKND